MTSPADPAQQHLKERHFWLKVRDAEGDKKEILLASRRDMRNIVNDLSKRDADEQQRPHPRWGANHAQRSDWKNNPSLLTLCYSTCCFPCSYAKTRSIIEDTHCLPQLLKVSCCPCMTLCCFAWRERDTLRSSLALSRGLGLVPVHVMILTLTLTLI